MNPAFPWLDTLCFAGKRNPPFPWNWPQNIVGIARNSETKESERVCVLAVEEGVDLEWPRYNNIKLWFGSIMIMRRNCMVVCMCE